MMLFPPSLVYEEMKDFNSDLVINSFEDITKVYHQILKEEVKSLKDIFYLPFTISNQASDLQSQMSSLMRMMRQYRLKKKELYECYHKR